MRSSTDIDVLSFRPAMIAALTLVLYALAALPALLHAEIAFNVGRPSQAWAALATLLLCLALVTLSTIDAVTLALPDAITLPLVGLGLVLAAVAGFTVLCWHMLAAVIAYGLLHVVASAYLAYRGTPGLGLGDAKLFASAGAWLGLDALATVLAYAAVAALIAVSVAAARSKSISMKTRIPFGPFLAFAIWLVWLYGPINAGPA